MSETTAGPSTLIFGGHFLEDRDAAMQELRDALQQAGAGRGRFALVSGDAGIGKSTVASAIAAEAESLGLEVQWGRAWEFADAPPYFPVRGALRALGIDPHEASFRDEEGGSFRLWEAVVEAFAAKASQTQKPIVWMLEDLHAADLLTLDLLTFLAQAIRGLRVLVVGTARAKDPRLDERASQRLTRMARDGIDLRLTPLTSAAVGAVAARVSGGGPLPSSVIDKLTELTGGNPLFVVECARAFKSSGSSSSAAITTLPPTVRHVVLDRFEQLPQDTRSALKHGAILGRELTAARVGRMQGALPARVIDALRPALRAGFVTEVEPGRFAFSHVIVRDVVEDSMPAEECARLHGLAEKALEGDDSSADAVVERARHALAASAVVVGGGQHAVDLARRAIELLEKDAAHDRAFGVCERLAAASDAAEIAAAMTNEDWMNHARIARAAGRHAECRRLCDRVLVATRSANDAKGFARAALLVGAEIRPAVVDSSLVSLLEEARAMLADAGDGDNDNDNDNNNNALSCRLEARLAGALQPHEDFRIPIAMAREAIARARGLNDDALMLDVLDMGVSALVDFAPIEERLAAYDEILVRATAIGDRPRMLRQHARLALDHAYIGDFEAFARDVDNALRVASDLGHPRFRWRALLMSSMRSLALGELGDSERAIVEVSELAAITDDPALELSLAAHKMHRAMVIQREEELRATIETLPSWFRGVSYGRALTTGYQAMVYARLDDVAGASRSLKTLGNDISFFEREISGSSFLAEAVAMAGSDVVRRRLRETLAAHEGLEAIGGHVPVSYEGPVARSMAIIDASLGDVASAERLLSNAIALARARGHRTWIAQMEYDLAKILTQAGQIDEGFEHAEVAASQAAELGLDGLAARARSILFGGGGAAPPPPQQAPAKPNVAATPTLSSTATKPTLLTPTASTPTFALASEGEVWRVTFGDRVVIRVRDSRGMQLLARLVERAGEEVHVLALASDAADGGAGAGGGVAETNTGDVVLDEKARRAYRDRMRELASEIDEAEQNADHGRLDKLRRENAMLEDEMARAIGLGGRSRKHGSATERARVNVQRRLKDALARVTEVDPTVGRFLERAVRTGTFCCYRP